MSAPQPPAPAAAPSPATMSAPSPAVYPIASRLSLRPPQTRSLEILSQLCDLLPLQKGGDAAAGLQAVRSQFPSVAAFEREFPSLCFALATGVGKTRLMGAFIAYLYRVQKVRNFFVLAPNLTIYNKLITDFTPNTPKYVFRGLADFAGGAEPPEIITADNYESARAARTRLAADPLPKDDGVWRLRPGVGPVQGFLSSLRDEGAGDGGGVTINIFNISKINSEVRGGKSPRIKRLSEYIGTSYFDYLAGLDDLVLLMDESHRYRASAGVRAINELKPILGLELTATPYVETPKGPVRFQNVVYEYGLAEAIRDGFVKDPAVVTRKDFSPAGMGPDQVERIKLEDGVRLHEATKAELAAYATNAGVPLVKPFLLVIARDTTHAGQLLELVKSTGFFRGEYAGKVIQVDSSKSGEEEEEMVRRLLAVERPDEPTEIVIHVNMLKEGWDVTNLYTIVPLRAANARILIEQSIGRGLRLPYGKRTGVPAVDTLNIVAHDRFQEIVDEANRPGSVIQVKTRELGKDELTDRARTIVSQSNLAGALGLAPGGGAATPAAGSVPPIPGSAAPPAPAFASPAEQEVARAAYEAIKRMEGRPKDVPTAAHLTTPEVQAQIAKAVSERVRPVQLDLPGVVPEVDVAAIVRRTAELVVRNTIDIPRIVVVPKGEVRSGFAPFTLTLPRPWLQAPDETLWQHHLQANTARELMVGGGGIEETDPRAYVVAGLIDFDDVSYDDHAELLYDLAQQVVDHLLTYLGEEQMRRVLRVYQRQVAEAVHTQMMSHYHEDAAEYEPRVTAGFTSLRDCAFTAADGEIRDFAKPVDDAQAIGKHVFGGFSRCLYPTQKFDSNTERKMAIILDRDAEKWFRPAPGQFQLYYRRGSEQPEYQPDFVAETGDAVYMIETKSSRELDDAEVLEKQRAAVEWCRHASDHSAKAGGKPWAYLLIPHDQVDSNRTLAGLAAIYRRTAS